MFRRSQPFLAHAVEDLHLFLLSLISHLSRSQRVSSLLIHPTFLRAITRRSSILLQLSGRAQRWAPSMLLLTRLLSILRSENLFQFFLPTMRMTETFQSAQMTSTGQLLILMHLLQILHLSQHRSQIADSSLRPREIMQKRW